MGKQTLFRGTQRKTVVRQSADVGPKRRSHDAGARCHYVLQRSRAAAAAAALVADLCVQGYKLSRSISNFPPVVTTNCESAVEAALWFEQSLPLAKLRDALVRVKSTSPLSLLVRSLD